MHIEPASVITGSWLALLGQHGPLVTTLSGKLEARLGSHLCNLAHHVMYLQTRGEIDERAIERAKKAHGAMNVFTTYASEAQYVLDAFALVAAAADAPATDTANAINALGIKHGMKIRASNTLAVRANRACRTLASLKSVGNIDGTEAVTGANGVATIAGVLASGSMRRVLNIPAGMEIGDFSTRCSQLIAKVKDTSRGHEVKAILDVVTAQLRAKV